MLASASQLLPPDKKGRKKVKRDEGREEKRMEG